MIMSPTGSPAVSMGADPALMPRSRRVRTGWRLLAPAFVLILSGCLSTFIEQPNPFASRSQRQIVIVVENQHLSSVTLSVISSEGRPRLGSVNPSSNASFTMPWRNATDLRIEITSVGRRNYTTGSLLVRPGERVFLRIDPNLSRSTLR